MGSMPMHLDYFEGSMFEAVEAIAEKYPNYVAFDFMGKSTTYKKLVQEVETCAKALKTIGVREGDKVTIAMPNCPQAIYLFYAINLVGGIANMVHPLSAEKEIESISTNSESVNCHPSISSTINSSPSARTPRWSTSSLPASRMRWPQPIKAGYMLTQGRKIEKISRRRPRSSAGRNSCG